jgi:hypothetical protein
LTPDGDVTPVAAEVFVTAWQPCVWGTQRDHFCVYVFDRLVLPGMSHEQTSGAVVEV